MKIAVAGTGYVGLSIATLLSQHNHVTAVDVIPEKVEKINNRTSPIQDEYIEKYLKEKQSEIFKTFETPLKNMTVSQGSILMRLIDREAGKSSFFIIKEYRNGIAAGFWQGVAKLFKQNLKSKRYMNCLMHIRNL